MHATPPSPALRRRAARPRARRPRALLAAVAVLALVAHGAALGPVAAAPAGNAGPSSPAEPSAPSLLRPGDAVGLVLRNAVALVAEAEAAGALSPSSSSALQALAASGWSLPPEDAARALARARAELEASGAPPPAHLGSAPVLATPPGLVLDGAAIAGCKERCTLEYYACVTVCFTAFMACVAGTSGWGVVLCYLGYTACVVHCKISYENCVEGCPGEDGAAQASGRSCPFGEAWTTVSVAPLGRPAPAGAAAPRAGS